MTRKIYFLLLMFSFGVFSQNSKSIQFEDFKSQIIQDNINFDEAGIDESTILNKTETKVLELLNNNSDTFENKTVTFISGSAGTTIRTKKVFFDLFKNRYFKNNMFINFSIEKLDEKSKNLSGSDYLVFFWVKTYNAKSKALLKAIKQTNLHK